ncbi:MAG: ABC transporter substrate-binding protein [Haloechinothrix sp.]
MSTSSRRRPLRLLVGLLAALSLVFTGCAVGPGSGEDSNGKPVLRAIFLPATWGEVVKDELAPQYERETGVRVDVQLIGRDAIHEKMATLFASQDASFDIFNVDYNWIPEFGRAGHLLDLSDQLTDEDRKDFFPQALRVATWDNKLYGVPQTIHPHLLWYRNDLFRDPKTQADFRRQTGRELAPPKTMDEWLQITEFFNGREYDGQTVNGWAAQAARGFGNVHTWLSFVYSYGGQPLTADFGQSQLSSEPVKKATAQWAEMMKYMPPGANDFTYDDVTTAAQQGTVATVLQWSWGAFAVDDPEKSRTVGDWSFVQVPAGTGGTGRPHLAEWVISVSKYSENAEEAKKFVTWLETKENDVLQASKGAGDPVRQSSYQTESLTSQTLPDSDVQRFRRFPAVLEAMGNAQPRPFFPAEERWETVVSPELSAISLGRRSVEEGLRHADEAVNQMLQR